MSIEVVGNEVLPNLYIKNIELSERNAKITVAAFDYMDEDGKVTWMTTEFVRNPRIKMNLIATKQGSTTDATLNSSGNYNLYNMMQSLPKTNDLKFTKENIQSLPLSLLDGVIREKLLNSTPGSYIQLDYTFSVAYDNIIDLEDLRCYCFFSYDAWAEQFAYFVDSEGDGKKVLSGPIFSETIISNGSIKQNTNRFSFDGSGYAGPVHFHDGRYMEGSFHEAEMHRFIDVESVRNTKISVVNYQDMVLPTIYESTNNENMFFGNPSIGVGYKKIYGFFRFKTEQFFRSKPLYNYFVNSFASLNLFKIRNEIRMRVNGELIEIKEIIMNSIQSNDMWFYFEAPFEEYVETSINIEFQVVNVNSIFTNTMINVREEANFNGSKIQTLIATADASNITIERPQEILNYIVSYCTLLSMFYTVDLVELKSTVLNSLYKSKISKNILIRYHNSYVQMVNKLSGLIQENPSTNTNIYSEEKIRFMQLENYKNCITYFNNNIVLHPDLISESLQETNNKATEMSGLFGNLEQILLPRYIRKDNGVLHAINYSDIHLNDSYLKVLEPNQVEQQDTEDSVDYDTTNTEDSEDTVDIDQQEIDSNSPGVQAQQYMG